MKFLRILAAVFSVMTAFADSAAENENSAWFSVGLLPVKYMEYPGPDANVRIMRLNLLAGCHRSMYGLDMGSVGNWTSGKSGGLSVAGGYAACMADCFGGQLSCVNFTEERHFGAQIGIVNTTWGLRGVQTGVVNATSDGYGAQIGLCNLAEDFSGLQLGLINMNHASPLLMMPILNVWF